MRSMLQPANRGGRLRPTGMSPPRRRDGYVTSSPTVVDDTVFVGSNDATLYALDADSGEQRWTFETAGKVESSPTVADGTVFVGGWESFYALDADSGDTEWTLDASVVSSPTVADGTVFVTGAGGSIYALAAATGDRRWAFETKSSLHSSPTVAGEVVIFESLRNVYALDVATGAQQWAFASGGRSSPTVVDGTVFVGSDDTNVYALRAGVDAESEGSRVRLGTLGHHSERRVE